MKKRFKLQKTHHDRRVVKLHNEPELTIEATISLNGKPLVSMSNDAYTPSYAVEYSLSPFEARKLAKALVSMSYEAERKMVRARVAKAMKKSAAEEIMKRAKKGS